MVGVSLRQKPASATDQNAHISLRPAAVRPVSGTPSWARNDHAPGAPRPASPWDTWTIPPKPAALNRTRKPSPHPIEPAAATAAIATTDSTATPEPSPPFRPWRIDYARPDVVEYPVDIEQPESSTVARRLLLLLGIAYLFLAALASGLVYTGYFTATATAEEEDSEDQPGELPPRPRPPSRDPNDPGLHTRPDGSRYLVMPLPADLADRLRGQASAAPAIGGGLL
ncbi:hypothetical protein [Glycomyces arizonensis]|uniref:hypothetical protein n=1 Tax=Glycomyces arizonensis TaxID=256035 RepID=UPI0012EB2413|nr:hypothetical protein [Glycomyces arizonensis]